MTAEGERGGGEGRSRGELVSGFWEVLGCSVQAGCYPTLLFSNPRGMAHGFYMRGGDMRCCLCMDNSDRLIQGRKGEGVEG